MYTATFGATSRSVGYNSREKLSGTAQHFLVCNGGGATEASWIGDSAWSTPIGLGLTAQGKRLVSQASIWQWGNDTHSTNLSNTYTNAQSTFGFDANKVHLLGVSMGGVSCLNWAKANPTKVKSISLGIPAIDIIDIDVNNRVASIGLDPVTQGPRAGYGGSTPDSAHNPASNTGSFSGMPIKIWYSNTDPVCIPSTITTFASAVGATAVNLGNNGHALTGLDVNQVVDWIVSNL